MGVCMVSDGGWCGHDGKVGRYALIPHHVDACSHGERVSLGLDLFREDFGSCGCVEVVV